MSNPKILERIKALYAAGEINDSRLAEYVTKGVITQADADEIREATMVNE